MYNPAWPKKILFIAENVDRPLDTYPGGGTKKHIIDLLDHLDRSKFHLEIIYSPSPCSDFTDFLANKQIPYYHIKMTRDINPLVDAIALIKICRHIRKHKYEIIHTFASKGGFIGRLAAKLSGASVIVHSPRIFIISRKNNLFLNGLYVMLERFAGIFTDKIIANSDSQKAQIFEYGLAESRKLVVIYNGIDVYNRIKPKHFAQNININFGTNNIITMVGRLNPPKDYLTFIRAAVLIKKLAPDTKFLIVGSGASEKKIKDFVKKLNLQEDVIFFGHRDDVEAILGISDIFVLSTRHEGCPYVILEAMVSGLPVVATDVAGCRDLVVDNQTGFLVEENNPDAMAEKITKLLKDEALRSQMGQWGFERVKNEFSLRKMIEKYENLYEQLSCRYGLPENI